MPVARDRGKSGNRMLLNEIVNFTALLIGGADVPAAKAGIPGTGPRAGNHPGRKVLRVGAHIQCRSCASPDLPGRFRILQSFQKPRFLLDAEDGLRGICLTEVRNLLVSETDGVGRLAPVVIPAAIDDLKHLLRHELRIVLIRESCVIELGSGVLRSVASLVGDNEFHVAAPAERPVSLQTMDRRKIVGFLPESMLIENSDRSILNLRWAETQKMPAWLRPCASARGAFCRRTLARPAILASCTHGYPTWERRASGHERPAGQDHAGSCGRRHGSHPR